MKLFCILAAIKLQCSAPRIHSRLAVPISEVFEVEEDIRPHNRDEVVNFSRLCQCWSACEQDNSPAGAEEGHEVVWPFIAWIFEIVGLISYDHFEIVEHILDFPGKVVGNYHCSDSFSDGGASLGIHLYFWLFDVVAQPIECLLLPVEAERGGAYD